MPGMKPRAKTLAELADAAAFYVAERPLSLDEKAIKLMTSDAPVLLGRLMAQLEATGDWSETGIENTVRGFAEKEAIKLGQIAQPLRVALTGSTVSPGIFEVMTVLGRVETLARIGDQAGRNCAKGKV